MYYNSETIKIDINYYKQFLEFLGLFRLDLVYNRQCPRLVSLHARLKILHLNKKYVLTHKSLAHHMLNVT